MRAHHLVAIVLAVAVTLGCGAAEDDGDRSAPGDSFATVPANEVLSRDAYMGVSCPASNEFRCDRVGLAVWLREPALEVDAAIAGRELELDDPEWSEQPDDHGRRGMFAGFLQPAGLIDGPIQVTPDDGPDRWLGSEPVSATVDLRIVESTGETTRTTTEVNLSPGWG
jgi:hypothetical protein